MAAGITNADYLFGTPTVTYTNSVTSPSVSTDGLTIYVDAPDGSGVWKTYVSTRETIHDVWPDGIEVTIPNHSYYAGNPDISADGLTLFFDSVRPDGQGRSDIWLTTRLTMDAPWSEPANLGPPINGPSYDGHSSTTADGLTLVFCSDRPGGEGDRDIYISTRATIDDPWSEPVNLGPIVNSPSRDRGPDISSDGLTLFFESRRPGGYGLEDIWVTRRATTDDPWGVPVNLGPIINDSNRNYTPCISADGSILYWWSQIGRLRQVPIIPIVDLNGDGFVDAADISIIVDNWHTENTLCDVAPLPFGDGFVDVQDLIVVAEHLFEEFPSLDLVSILVDDFESYIVEGGMFDPGQIYFTWIDGYDDDQNGSQVGYANPPWVEPTIVHGDSQSMPFFYDNSNAPISRTFRQWEDPQDWTLGGPQLLTLWIYGQADNSVEPFYIILEDNAGNMETVTLTDLDSTTESWQQLSIPLDDFVGVDLKAIKRMYMGVGDESKPGGSGKLFIDDIELHGSSGE